MKPAPFVHIAPTSVAEVLALLSQHAPDARVLAGGQSLVPMMNFRLSRPSTLIDLNRVPELSYIRDAGDHLLIGAMTRERDIENSQLVRSTVPLLHAATLNIAHLPIRSRGTIGGSIANADPAAEYPAATLALGCTMAVRSARGERRIEAADFFLDILTTAIEPDELLVEIVVPKPPPNSGSAFVEIARRHGDYALAGTAATVTLSDGVVSRVRLAACGVGSTPIRLLAAEASVLGKAPTTDTLEGAAIAAANEVDPQGDTHATANYRRQLAGTVTRRALSDAVKQVVQTA